MSQAQVIARINDHSAQTGVEADIATGGETRLYSTAFGDDANIDVISSLATAADQSGFNNFTDSDTGTDVVVTIGSDQFVGSGNVVTADYGDAKGLSLEIAEDPADVVNTVAAGTGQIEVIDNSLDFQIGPNANQSAAIAVGRANANSLAIGVADNQFANLSEIKVNNADRANDSLAVIDEAIDDITNLRGRLGAFQQNTLESTASNLRTTLENTINAESVIRDTDFAQEISEFTKQQVLQQAGAATLSSANQVPQLVLSLLG